MPEEIEQKETTKEKKDVAIKKRPVKKSGKQIQPKQKVPTTRVKEGWTLKSFAVRIDHMDKLEAIAYKERKPLKQILDDALTAYLKNKKISPVLLKRG